MKKYVRFLRDQSPFWGVVEGSQIRALTGAPYLGGQEDSFTISLAEAELLAPCEPNKILCVGKNYYEHALEMQGGVPETPLLFIKPNTCVNHPGATVVRPRNCQALDYEGELAFVVGKTAKRVPAGRADEYIFGYTILNDVTARDIQQADGQWTRGKCFDGFAPIGPYLTTGIDASDLPLTTRLNGVVKQSARTSQMMWKVPKLLEFITEGITLLPGDMVTTGTPAGIGPMGHGDTVEVEIEGLGVLSNPIAWEIRP